MSSVIPRITKYSRLRCLECQSVEVSEWGKANSMICHLTFLSFHLIGGEALYLSFSRNGLRELFEVELLHFHYRLHHPLYFLFVSTLKYLENNVGNDLPEKAKLVL